MEAELKREADTVVVAALRYLNEHSMTKMSDILFAARAWDMDDWEAVIGHPISDDLRLCALVLLQKEANAGTSV